MDKTRINKLRLEIKKLHDSVSELRQFFESKKQGFTLDGRLVGDIGEVVAEELFQIKLHREVKKYYDADTTYKPKLQVQIKATFQEHLTYNHQPDYVIGLKLFSDGHFDVVYNGPGKYIQEAFSHRKHIGEKLLRFPIKRLSEISDSIPQMERILMKEGAEEILSAMNQ